MKRAAPEGATVPPRVIGQMLVSCVRYALGRQTYIVSDTCSWVRQYWSFIEPDMRAVILRDIAEASNRGADCDNKEWCRLLTTLEETR